MQHSSPRLKVALFGAAALSLTFAPGCCKKKTKRSLPRVADPVRYELVSRSSRHLLTDSYPRTDLRLEFSVRYTSPGTIIDTVGIGTARVGSFTISILKSGKIRAQIFDPGRSSPVKRSDGWHVMESTESFRKDYVIPIAFELYHGDIALWVGGKLASRLHLATPLSGEPVYIGDFPGDDGLGARYNIHPAMVGGVFLAYFGKLDPAIYKANRRAP